MTLEYTLLVAVIGVPLMALFFRLGGIVTLLFEIAENLWMLPI